MKRLIFSVILLLLLLYVPVFAGNFYIVNPEGKVVAQCQYIPDQGDLATRGEYSIYSDEDIPLHEAVLKNEKIARKVKSAQEISEEIKAQEKANEEELIKETMRQLAIDQLKTEGHLFKYIEEEKK